MKDNLILYSHSGAPMTSTSKDIEYLLKSIKVPQNATIVDYGGSDGGQVGTTIAWNYRRNHVHTVATNVKDVHTAEMNISKNSLANLTLCISKDLAFLDRAAVQIIIIRPPNFEGKEETRFRISEALRYLAPDGKLYVVTHTHRGANSLMETIEEIFGNHTLLQKGGGGIRIVSALRPKVVSVPTNFHDVSESIQADIFGKRYFFRTTQGTFSRSGVDAGTIFLLESIHFGDARTILDLGCGYGVIGIVIADRHPESKVILSDIDVRAIDNAIHNVELNHVKQNSRVVLSDGLAELAELTFDLVLSHIPLHISRSEQIRLLTEIRNALNPAGRICLVVHTSYDLRPVVQDVFGNVQVIADSSHRQNVRERFRVLCATAPS